MKNPRAYRARPRGFTILEVAIAAAMLGIVLTITVTALHSSLLAVTSTSLQCSLENQASRCMEVIARELQDGGTKYANFAISSDQQSITFARCNGYTAAQNNTPQTPVFGNQITYAVVTSGTDMWLERREVVNGSTQTETLTQQLNQRPFTVQTIGGTNITVTGANFQMLSSGIVTVTLALSSDNALLKTNSATVDDTLVVTSQSCIQMLNN